MPKNTRPLLMGQNSSKKYIEIKKSSDQQDKSCQILQYVMARVKFERVYFFYTPWAIYGIGTNTPLSTMSL